MKTRLLTVIALLAAIWLPAYAQTWERDTLSGKGYYDLTINQPDDYQGKVVSTVIRKLSDCANKRAILYVHGFNDYFFQTEMGDRFVDSCYNFYAVDLRRYGRSLRKGERKFDVRNLRDYFPDIDSALSVIKRDGNREVILMGHSTGGLITSLFMAEKPDTIIKGLILNSPFLDWNLSKFNERVAVPLVSFIGGLFPRINIKQGDSDIYARSLLKEYDGEWTYDTDLKLVHSPDVTSGWIRAINTAQHLLRKKSTRIDVPILLLHSDRSEGAEGSTYMNSDCVLDVKDISKYGRKLGPDVTEETVAGGLHDLALSAPAVRNKFYTDIFQWLDKNGL